MPHTFVAIGPQFVHQLHLLHTGLFLGGRPFTLQGHNLFGSTLLMQKKNISQIHQNTNIKGPTSQRIRFNQLSVLIWHERFPCSMAFPIFHWIDGSCISTLFIKNRNPLLRKINSSFSFFSIFFVHKKVGWTENQNNLIQRIH